MRHVLVLASTLLATSLSAQQTERFTLPGNSVAIYNLVGVVRVVGGTGEATAEVTRGGPDASQLRVETGVVRDRQTLRVVYPGSDVIAREFGRYSTTRTRVNSDGTFGDGGDGDGRTVTIRGGRSFTGGGLEARADVTLRVPKGVRLAVHLAVGEVTVTNVDGNLLVDVASARVTTTGTSGDLTLDTGSGAVEVSDVEGDLSLDTGSGSVRVSRVRGKRVTVDAGSGSLTGSDITVEDLTLDLGSGGARLSGVRAENISLDSGSGSVDLGLAADVSALEIDSGSGSVTLRVPSSLGATVEVDAGSGGVESDVPMTITRRSRSELTGQIGDGRGRIKIDAGSGRVSFRKS